MLERLSGRTHEVVSGLCLRTADWEESGRAVTAVTFRDLSPEEIAAYVETLRALTQAAASQPQMFGPIAAPNPLIANMAKLHFASGYHAFTAKIQDIAGGIVATAPDRKDWDNPETRGYLEHYLGGSDRFSTLDRLKMIHETMRQVCSHESAFHQVMSVHAEGSMAAQKMMILAEAPMARYEQLANAFAGIHPWAEI